MLRHFSLELLSAFTVDEMKRLGKFLGSPLHNSNKALYGLFQLISRRHPGFTDDKISKQYLFKKLYPGKQYKDSTMRNLLSELAGAAQKYLAMEEFLKDTQQENNYLLKSLRMKNRHALLKKRLEASEKSLSLRKLEASYFYEKYRAENNSINYSITYAGGLKKKTALKRVERINSSSAHLTAHCLTELIMRFAKIKMTNEKYGLAEKNNHTKNIIKNINMMQIASEACKNAGQESCSIMIQLYSHLYKMLRMPSDIRLYFRYKTIYLQNISRFSSFERGFHNSNLINYCIAKINNLYAGHDFREELFQHYTELLENKYYINGLFAYMPSALFRAVLITALNLRRYHWALQFINANVKNLHQNERENIHNLALFLYSGYTAKYKDAFRYMHMVNYDNFIYKYDEYALKVKIYYEMGDTESGLYAVKSFKAFLRNNDVGGNPRKKRYTAFLNYLEKLFDYRSGKTKIDLGYIRQQVINLRNISHRQWLIDKIDLLLNK